MHTAIFKLFPSVVNPVGCRVVNSSAYKGKFMIRYRVWYEFDMYPMCRSVDLRKKWLLFICAKFSRQCIKKLQRFLQVCKKNNLSPSNPPKKKKRRKTQKFDHPYLMNDYYKLIKSH